VTDNDFGGRKWEPKVYTASDSRQADRSKKAVAKAQQDAADEVALLAALDSLDPTGSGAGVGTIRTRSGLSRERFDRAADRLHQTGIIHFTDVMVPIANGAQRKSLALRRAAEGD